mgnify:CR=1 FL=1
MSPVETFLGAGAGKFFLSYEFRSFVFFFLIGVLLSCHQAKKAHFFQISAPFETIQNTERLRAFGVRSALFATLCRTEREEKIFFSLSPPRPALQVTK